VPHVLPGTLPEDRLARPIELLPILLRAEQTNWHLFLTDDEFWFFCYPPNSRIWLPPDAEMPEVAPRLPNTPKIMVTLFWNPSGLYVNRILNSETSFNSAYFLKYVLSETEHLSALQTAIGQKKKFIHHMDNSPIHKFSAVTERMISLRLALEPYPPYSPDLTPSDFFFFGYLKEKMLGINFGSPKELIYWIQLTCEAIPRHVLDKLFESWLRRVQDYINSQRSYIKA
jgi:histone-lysine N-methyltransferase SETMAR